MSRVPGDGPVTAGRVTQAEADAFAWYHSIDLGGGVVTRGQSDTVPLDGDRFPDVAGRSVLDIGAWDGYYSFEAERRGAARVVALDHYVWCLDFGARAGYWDQCRREGVFPDPDRDEVDFWHADAPGKAAFDFARGALASSVESVVADFMTVDLDALGPFDVVFHLGVLYHVMEPFTALRRLRRVTKEVAVIETVAVSVEHQPGYPFVAFFGDDDLSGDFGNWFAPSERALHDMCRAAGFASVETKLGPAPFEPVAPVVPPRGRLGRRPPPPPPPGPRVDMYRLVVHARP